VSGLRIFVLTKSEQRVVIVIVLLLVGIALVKRHYDLRGSVLPAVTSPAQTPRPARFEKESAQPDND